MKPISPAPATPPSPGDRLATLAATLAQTQGRARAPDTAGHLEAFRDGLNAIAHEAEAGDQGSLARALRRIALLSEVWECLESEPGQAEAAADVASFCLEADRAPGPRPADRWQCAANLRSATRSSVSPTCAGATTSARLIRPALASQSRMSRPSEDACFIVRRCSPALDQDLAPAHHGLGCEGDQAASTWRFPDRHATGTSRGGAVSRRRIAPPEPLPARKSRSPPHLEPNEHRRT